MSDGQARAAGLTAASEALAAGELVGMPTETVYGLAADATNGMAVARVFAAKARPQFNPLIVHVGSLAEAERIAEFGQAERRLAKALWPGPLTLVLPRRSTAAIADLATAGLDTIAIRAPAHPIARALIDRFGAPVAAPSANRSGRLSPTTAAHVDAELGDAVACILDAGPCRIGIESTIVVLSGGEGVLLRPGGIARGAVEEVLGMRLKGPPEQSAVAAPGMLASHYAPKSALRINAQDVRPGETLIAFGQVLPKNASVAAATVNLSPAGDLTEAAANLFSALRSVDERGTAIAVMPIPETGLGEAINDRLRRAAAPRS